MMEKIKHFRLKWILRMGFCLALIAAMVLIGAVLAGAEEVKYSEGLAFKSNGDGTCSVSGIGTCTDTEIVIPPVSPFGDRVIQIEEKAFSKNEKITELVISDEITSIGAYAFQYCKKLTSITIGKGVIDIGGHAFEGCSYLESIYFNAIAMNNLSVFNSVFLGAGSLGEGISVLIVELSRYVQSKTPKI